MRKYKVLVSFALAFVMFISFAQVSYARAGQMGFFGGISEGSRLPKTTEIILRQSGNQRSNNNNENLTNLAYKEILWLTGVPVEWEGLLSKTVSAGGGRSTNTNVGTRTVRYQIRNSDTSPEEISLTRDITYTVNWRREGNQIVEDWTVTRWSEVVVVGGTAFTLDQRQSHHHVSILRDLTPGVSYYAGDVSQRAVFTGEEDTVIHEVIGQIFGYESAWSVTETHRLDGIVSTADWQVQYQIVPSVSVSKHLQYGENEPTLISFAGNYREVMSNQSALSYVIHVVPNIFYGIPTSGSASIHTFNSFEQLIAPNLNFLRGHWAYGDIRRLFAMEILRGDPAHFQPNQGVTRGEFVTMLARAVKLPLDSVHMQPPRGTRGNVNVTTNLIFPDVWHGRPDFPYIMAVHETGIAIGRGDGHFQPDEVLQRQEAYVLALRFLGLSNLGLEPTPITPYVDDNLIGDWARRDIYAATRIGLIFPDENGMLHPRELMHKAEAAALINRLIEYMRHELQMDYTENVVNFMN